MSRSKLTPESIAEACLATIIAKPRSAGRAFSEATDGKHGAAVRSALEKDPRFGPALRVVIRERSVLKETPWLVQLLGDIAFAPAVPELLAIWRWRNEDVSYQAGNALIEIGDRAALKALAADVEVARGSATFVAVDAAFALDPSGAYARLAPLVRKNHRCAEDVLARVAREKRPFAKEPRWKALALEVIRGRPSNAADAAWALLRGALKGKALGQALAEGAPPPAPPSKAAQAAREKQLGQARERMAPVIDVLLERGARPAAKSSVRELREIETLAGPLPAFVRVFYERVHGLDLGPKKSRQRLVVNPLSQALGEARRWATTYGLPHAPRALVPEFDFPVAPDAYALRGLSGGPDYGFAMPSRDEDPRIEGLRGNPRFSELLKRAAAKRA